MGTGNARNWKLSSNRARYSSISGVEFILKWQSHICALIIALGLCHSFIVVLIDASLEASNPGMVDRLHSALAKSTTLISKSKYELSCFQWLKIAVQISPRTCSKHFWKIANFSKADGKLRKSGCKQSNMTDLQDERERFAAVTLARYGVGDDLPVCLDVHPQKGR